MKRLISIVYLLIVPLYMLGQSANNFDKVWVQGGPMAYYSQFNSGGVVSGFIDTSKYPRFFGGHSNICDSQGRFILACNGYRLFGQQLNLIEGGDTVVSSELCKIEGGWGSYSQSSVFLPFRKNQYYLVTPNATDSNVRNLWANNDAQFDQMIYAKIDMSLNAGAGKVLRKKVVILDSVRLNKVQMMACKHGNGIDWWLLKHDFGDKVYKFLFKQDTVLGPFVQTIPVSFATYNQSGQSVFSRDGTKYATTCRGAGKILVANFDRCTGLLGNPTVYNVPVQPYGSTIYNDVTNGLAFSPNGRFVYVNGFFNIQQMDLQDANPASSWVKVADKDTTAAAFQEYSSMYLGPDDKLYVGNWNGFSNAMSVINNPNNKGVACNFCPKCLRFPIYYNNGIGYSGVSSPPCMPNYRLGAATPICWPTGVDEVKEEVKFSVYPNPATTTLQFEYSRAGKVVLTDVTGRQVRLLQLPGYGSKQSIDISNLSAGVYVYEYLVDEQVQARGKVMIK